MKDKEQEGFERLLEELSREEDAQPSAHLEAIGVFAPLNPERDAEILQAALVAGLEETPSAAVDQAIIARAGRLSQASVSEKALEAALLDELALGDEAQMEPLLSELGIFEEPGAHLWSKIRLNIEKAPAPRSFFQRLTDWFGTSFGSTALAMTTAIVLFAIPVAPYLSAPRVALRDESAMTTLLAQSFAISCAADPACDMRFEPNLLPSAKGAGNDEVTKALSPWLLEQQRALNMRPAKWRLEAKRWGMSAQTKGLSEAEALRFADAIGRLMGRPVGASFDLNLLRDNLHQLQRGRPKTSSSYGRLVFVEAHLLCRHGTKEQASAVVEKLVKHPEPLVSQAAERFVARPCP